MSRSENETTSSGRAIDRIAELLERGIAPAPATSDDMRRIRILAIATAGLVAMGGVITWRYWQLGLWGLGSALLLTMVAAVANLRMLRAGWSASRCGHVALALLMGFQLLSVSVSGGFYDPNFAWLYVMPLAAAIVLDRKGAAIWTGVTLAAAVGSWSLHELGLVAPNLVPIELRSGQALFDRVSAIVAIGLIGWSFVTGQRRAERALEEANTELFRETAYVQLLLHAAVAANEAASFEEALDDSVERICAAMGWAGGHVYERKSDGSLVSTGRIHTGGDPRLAEVSAYSARQRFEPGEGLPGRVAAAGRPERMDDISAPGLRERAGVAARAGLRSAFAIPILVGGEVAAVLEFASTQPLPRDERLLEVFTHIGTQLGRVAERTALEKRLRQSQKLEAIGQLAAGLAHEINNPMAYVRSNLRALESEWQEIRSKLDAKSDAATRLDECEELVAESLEGVERAVAILRDVKEFSHSGGGGISWELGDVGEIVDAAVRVASARRPSEHIRIEIDHTPLPRIQCSPHQLQQVFVNLVVNAIQAVAARGDRGSVRLESGSDAEGVYVRVKDDGVGIPHSVRERIFDPFFTTKRVGEGTGLGLYLSYEIVRNHGGEIRVHSELDRGTTFEVRLPLAPKT